MGFDFGALLRGTARGITGYEEGKRQRAEAERQARLQLLQESLTKAQLGDYQALAQLRQSQARAAEAKPYTTEITDEEWQGFTADKPQLKGIPKAARLKVLEQWSESQFKPPTPDRPIAVSPGGTVVDPKTGKTIYHAPERPKTPSALDEKVRLGARNAANAIQQAVALVGNDPEANVLPVSSEIAGSAAESPIGKYLPGLSGAAGYLRRTSMGGTQNQFQNLLNVVAHNSVGLLPGSRQSLVLFQNLRDSYATQAGDPPELRAQKLANLHELGKRLELLAEGKDVSLADLPGFEDFQPLSGEGETPTPRTPTQTGTPTAETPAQRRARLRSTYLKSP